MAKSKGMDTKFAAFCIGEGQNGFSGAFFFDDPSSAIKAAYLFYRDYADEHEPFYPAKHRFAAVATCVTFDLDDQYCLVGEQPLSLFGDWQTLNDWRDGKL